MNPLISVITPCYNHGQFLDEAVSSIYPEVEAGRVEHIIINDGSTDEATLTKLEELQHRGCIVIHKTNGGLGAARNSGIAIAKGKYLLPLDSDNKLVMKIFLDAATIMERDSDIDVIYTDCEYFDGAVAKFVVGPFKIEKLISQNYIDACALIRTSTMLRVGCYDEAMPVMGHEDWELWIRLFVNNAKFRYLPEVGYYYRVRTGSMIRTDGSANRKRNQEYIFQKYLPVISESFAQLVEEKEKLDFVRWYAKNSKWKAIVKILLGKPLS
jgi:glycosyltransferase involved in cell wall biosynthesis